MAAGDEVVVLTGSLKGSLGMILGTSKFLIGCYRVRIYGRRDLLPASFGARKPTPEQIEQQKLQEWESLYGKRV